jgi:RNA polymerase sigma-70 factor, ECF subfamily
MVLSIQSAPPDQRFVALYETHAGAVLAYARRRIGPDQAEDVLAETFLVAWRRRGDVPSDALPWLYAVAANVLRNRARSARRQTALEARLAAEPALGAPDDDPDPDPRLREALAALKPIDREALLLTAWEGLAPDRAARAAGCSRATFHVRLHRARRRLAQALEELS